MNISKTSTLTLDNYYSQKKQTKPADTKFTIEETKEEKHPRKKSAIPEDAPQEVKDAWSKLTQEEKFSISRSILISTAESNMRVDKDGRLFRIEPGSPNHIDNIMETMNFDIFEFIDSSIEKSYKNINMFPDERNQHLDNIKALEKFKELLQKDLPIE